MKLSWQRVIQEHRQVVLSRWLDLALALFPDTLAASGPACQALSESMGMVLDRFEEGGEACASGVDGIARLLAVIPAPPSRSMSVFTGLRELLDAVAPLQADRSFCRERIDAMTMAAFDRFMEHRETIYKMKVEEARRSMHMLLRRAG
ncbi:MAG: hypothetical protein HGB29_00365 [Chlorobiaceae bacterium]|nr:hypothetical protein [Chlorobiaceae bacterium]NTW73299.1 hypothetical protein [Chlorobiaceae bacterium]